MDFFSKLFGTKKNPTEQSKEEQSTPEEDFSEEEFDRDYDLKTEGLEAVLGKMYGLVGHAIIPFSIGGAVDLYYFTEHIEGTGFATMELLDPNGYGPLRNRLGTYELVAFTKLEYNDNIENPTPFNLIERRVCGFLTGIGSYSSQAVLNPGDTIEVPNGEGEENTCLIFDLYEPDGITFMIGERRHHLLLCLQIFRSEMEYARKNGSEELFALLKAASHYPYSDLDRESVA